MSNTSAPSPNASRANRSESIAPTRARASARTYLRKRDLPRLIPLWPSELEVISSADHLRLLARLRRALRVERQRGLAGHWAYDLARHAQLLRAYRAETIAYVAARSTIADPQSD